MRRTLPIALGLLLATAACGPAEVVVTMEIDLQSPDGEGMVNRPLSEIEVQLLPFDRDAVFEEMAAAYGVPEPEVPQELIERRDEVQAAQLAWDDANRRWATIRDTLQKLNDAMAGYSRGESQYVMLFQEWQDWDSEYGDTEREVERTFAAFTALQEGTISSSDSVRILQESWGDEAFVDIGTVFAEQHALTGLDWVVDTTDANGVARGNLKVKPGTYWVYARYEMPYTELYWNLRIEVVGGEPMTVELNRGNAEERIKL
jgi:hypothetical protein